MMEGSGLIENYNSREMERAGILTNKPRMVKVWVEDDSDIPFWKDLLQHVMDQCKEEHAEVADFEFQFTSYTTEAKHLESSLPKGANGRRSILKLEAQLGNFLVACVDSDYNFLIPSLPESQIIDQSHYIVQSYAYSIENYMCHSSTLIDLCQSNCPSPITFDFDDFYRDYSKAIYPLLVWSIYLEELGNRELPRKTLSGYFYSSGNVKETAFKATMLKNIEKQVEAEIQRLEQKFPTMVAPINTLKLRLSANNLLQNTNAYWYVRGHNLFDFTSHNFVKPFSTCDKVMAKTYLNNNFEYKYKADALLYVRYLEPAIRQLLHTIG